jgi:hypothetical protein
VGRHCPSPTLFNSVVIFFSNNFWITFLILGGVCVAGGISGDLGISFVVPNGFWDVEGVVYKLASVFFASTFVGALGGPPIDLGAFGPPPP